MPETMELRLSLRPYHLAVLLPENASAEQLRIAVELLSMIWGGEYSHIFNVGTDSYNSETSKFLRRFRPDIVVGIGVKHTYWEKQANTDCQPFHYVKLDDDDIFKAFKFGPELIWARSAIDALVEDYPTMTPDKSRGVIWNVSEDSRYSLYIDYAMGRVPSSDPESVAADIGAEYIPVSEDISFPRLIEMFEKSYGKWTWPDLAGYELQSTSLNFGALPPTILVVANPSTDLPLYWNLRVSAGRGAPSRLLPLPVECIDDDEAIEAVASWVGAWKSRPAKPTYANILSRSIGPPDMNKSEQEPLHRLARKLRPRTRKFDIPHIDVMDWNRMLSTVLPKHKSEVVTTQKHDRKLIFAPLRPRFARHLSNRSEWVLELVKDEMQGKLPFRFSCPPSRPAVATLRAGIPPRISTNKSVGLGIQGVAVRCSNKSDRVVFEYPSAAETLEAHLRSCQIIPHDDEKRNAYESAVKLFGSLYKTAQCLTGTPGRIINAFIEWDTENRSKSRSMNRSINDLKRLARTGKGAVGKESDIDQYLDLKRDPEAAALTVKRFEQYFKEDIARAVSVEELMGKWSARKIVLTHWELVCPRCSYSNWFQHGHSGSVKCAVCNASSVLDACRDIRYQLNPLIVRALIEGMTPVILLARFLHNLHHDGLSIMPGVKATYQAKGVDIDLLACCDGELLVAECKSLSEGIYGTTTAHLSEQMRSLVELAKASGAKACFVASLVKKYPADIIKLAKKLNSLEVQVTLLTRQELIEGYSKDSKGQKVFHIGAFMPSAPKKRRRRKKGKREIRLA